MTYESLKEQRLRRSGKVAEADQCRLKVAQLQQRQSVYSQPMQPQQFGSVAAPVPDYSMPPPSYSAHTRTYAATATAQ